MVDVNQVLIHCMHMTNATTITSRHQLNVTTSIAMLRKAGWYPLHAELFTGVGPTRLYAEWPSEDHARKFAAEFAKHTPCAVAYDRDCGWSTELELSN